MNTHQSLFFAFISIMHSKLLHNPYCSTTDWLLLFYLRRLLQQCTANYSTIHAVQQLLGYCFLFTSIASTMHQPIFQL